MYIFIYRKEERNKYGEIWLRKWEKVRESVIEWVSRSKWERKGMSKRWSDERACIHIRVYIYNMYMCIHHARGKRQREKGRKYRQYITFYCYCTLSVLYWRYIHVYIFMFIGDYTAPRLHNSSSSKYIRSLKLLAAHTLHTIIIA